MYIYIYDIKNIIIISICDISMRTNNNTYQEHLYHEQEEEEEVYEVSDISIQSNMAAYKKSKRADEPSSTQFESNFQEGYSDKTQLLKKKMSGTVGDDFRSSKEKESEKMHSKQKKKKKGKETSGTSNNPQGASKYETLLNRVSELQKNTNSLQQKFLMTIKGLRDQINKKQQKNSEIKSDIETVKKDLNDRKRDINLLISMIKQLTVGGTSDIPQSPPVPTTSIKKESPGKKIGSERDLKSSDKIKKNSNEKQKKNIPGGVNKKNPIEMKQKVVNLKSTYKM